MASYPYAAPSPYPANAFHPTLSDTAILAAPALGFIPAISGAVAVMPAYQENQSSPTAVTITVVAGSPVNLQISRFMATNTTLTGAQITALGPV